jgi:UPF0755 protein
MKRKNSCAPLFLLVLLVVLILAVIIYIPVFAEQSFGSPNPVLNFWDRYSYAIALLWSAGDLSIPVQPGGKEQLFTIESGESVTLISTHLESLGLIRNSRIFRIYLIWKGLDISVQAGKYRINPGMTGIEIANALQDSTPSEITYNVLAGWRMEEIAASLPTSGFNIDPEEFLDAARNPDHRLEFLPENKPAEGFLFPGSYSLPRDTTADQLVSILFQNFSSNLTLEMRENISRQGLDIYQAVILASIIEKEAVISDESPLIASVFYNRLNIGMKLDSDPTVQYAVGFDNTKRNWWKNPLTISDLAFDSPFNTYIYTGLPPTPISNPGPGALHAVAFPAQSPYFYFRARCDGSGLHAFSETFDQHLQNGCN